MPISKTNVSQKSGPNKAILNAVRGMLRTFLTYKAARRGKLTIATDPKNTSRECPVCGHTHPDNRQEQSLFVCQACGFTQNADTNAAGIVKLRGIDDLLSGKSVPKERKNCGIKKRKTIGTEDPEFTPGESVSDHACRKAAGQRSPNRETPG